MSATLPATANSIAPVTRPYWIHVLSPLHVGSGKGVGFIDLPILREAVTKWPAVPGSAVKGVVRDHYDAFPDSKALLEVAFGKADGDVSIAGSVVFTDARLVCLPVRSFYGTFAWCTSPIALERLQRDCRFVDAPALALSQWPAETLLVATGSKLTQGGRAALEDLDFDPAHVQEHSAATAWAGLLAQHVFDETDWQQLFKERFAIVPEDIFNFLCETSTQVDARVRIEPATRTVASGALWYEESLPTETILAGLAWCGPVFGEKTRGDVSKRDELLTKFCTDSLNLQIGGKATVGRGQVRIRFGTTE